MVNGDNNSAYHVRFLEELKLFVPSIKNKTGWQHGLSKCKQLIFVEDEWAINFPEYFKSLSCLRSFHLVNCTLKINFSLVTCSLDLKFQTYILHQAVTLWSPGGLAWCLRQHHTLLAVSFDECDNSHLTGCETLRGIPLWWGAGHHAWTSGPKWKQVLSALWKALPGVWVRQPWCWADFLFGFFFLLVGLHVLLCVSTFLCSLL